MASLPHDGLPTQLANRIQSSHHNRRPVESFRYTRSVRKMVARRLRPHETPSSIGPSLAAAMVIHNGDAAGGVQTSEVLTETWGKAWQGGWSHRDGGKGGVWFFKVASLTQLLPSQASRSDPQLSEPGSGILVHGHHQDREVVMASRNGSLSLIIRPLPGLGAGAVRFDIDTGWDEQGLTPATRAGPLFVCG